ncbi:MAG: hypothetical protein FJ286_03810 [Planctomycetes bacterium]|nr:hypothetical protein [Planctomycetota bacterium]
MTIRATLRRIERSVIRPAARTVRGVWQTLRGGGHHRVAGLERRVDELESLVRELTGLAYLRLADEEAADDDRTAA